YPPYRILTASSPGRTQPLRIGVLGLVSDEISLFAFGPGGRSLVTGSMRQALERYVPELRSQADIVILLAEERPEAFAELLKGVKGIDLIVAGRGVQLLK